MKISHLQNFAGFEWKIFLLEPIFTTHFTSWTRCNSDPALNSSLGSSNIWFRSVALLNLLRFLMDLRTYFSFLKIALLIPIMIKCGTMENRLLKLVFVVFHWILWIFLMKFQSISYRFRQVEDIVIFGVDVMKNEKVQKKCTLQIQRGIIKFDLIPFYWTIQILMISRNTLIMNEMKWNRRSSSDLSVSVFHGLPEYF